MSFIKDGVQMKVTNIEISALAVLVRNYAFKENWKSTAGITVYTYR